MASSNTTIGELDSAKRKALGSWAASELKAGSDPAAVAQALQSKYPTLSLSDVLPSGPKPSITKGMSVMIPGAGMVNVDLLRNMGRSAAQGLTMEHADELSGYGAKLANDASFLMGGQRDPNAYAAERDAMRSADQQFQQQHGIVDFLMRMGGAAVPTAASLMIPGAQPVAGETLLNLGRAAVQGAGMGALQGEGASMAETPEGVMRDAKVGAAFGGGAGVVGSAIGQGLAARAANRSGRTATDALQSEATSVLPQVGERSLEHGGTIDPAVIARRQEKLAPKTTVVASLNPSAQSLLADIGADRVTATKALQEAAGRVRVLQKAEADIGKFYNGLSGIRIKFDPSLRDALEDAAKAVGRNKQLQLADVDVRAAGGRVLKDGAYADAGDLHKIRSVLLANARKAKKSNPGLSHQLDDVADRLTTAIEPVAPNIRQVDAEYAFIGDRVLAENTTRDIIKESLDRWALSRVRKPPVLARADMTQVPTTGTRVGTTVLKYVDKATGDTPEARAKALYGFLLNPATTDETLARTQLLQILGQTLKGRAMPNVGMAAGLAGQGANTIRTQP